MSNEPRDPILATIFRATVRVAKGSGVVIRNGKATLIATAAHVVRGGEMHAVRRGAIFRECSVIARDDDLDVAVLEPPPELEAAAIAVADEAAEALPGDPICAAGFPRTWVGSEPVIVPGAVAGVGEQSWLNLDGTWGNSGGPICRVVHDQPMVVGILLGNASEASNALDQFDKQTKVIGDRLAAFAESMAATTPELQWMRGQMGLMASHMSMAQAVGALVRQHFRTGFVNFAPVADLRKLLSPGDLPPSL